MMKDLVRYELKSSRANRWRKKIFLEPGKKTYNCKIVSIKMLYLNLILVIHTFELT